MRAALLATLLVALTVPVQASADEIPFRLYTSQAGPFVANLEQSSNALAWAKANKIALHLILKVVASPTEVASAVALKARMTALGIKTMPGFRCMESTAAVPGGYIATASWQRCGDYVRIVSSAFHMAPGDLMPLDLEDYSRVAKRCMGTMDAQLACQRAAMAPLFAALGDTGVMPAIYPAGVDDVPTYAIGDALSGKLELWSESLFDLSEFTRRGISAPLEVKFAGIFAAFQARYPGAGVRGAAYDDLLRDWGALQRSKPLVGPYGSRLPWIFLTTRQDEALIGLPEWRTGASLSSTNNPQQNWIGAPLASTAITGVKPLTITQALPASGRADLRSDQGFFLNGGRVLFGKDTFTSSTAWSLAVEVVLPPTGGGIVFGASQTNSRSWQVGCDDVCWLEVFHSPAAGRPASSRATISAAPRGVPLRLTLALNKKGDVWGYSGGSWTPLWPTLKPAGHLWVGAGITWAAGLATQVVFEGVVFKNAEIFPRTFTAPELVALQVSAYPRGR